MKTFLKFYLITVSAISLFACDEKICYRNSDFAVSYVTSQTYQEGIFSSDENGTTYSLIPTETVSNGKLIISLDVDSVDFRGSTISIQDMKEKDECFSTDNLRLEYQAVKIFFTDTLYFDGVLFAPETEISDRFELSAFSVPKIFKIYFKFTENPDQGFDGSFRLEVLTAENKTLVANTRKVYFDL